MVDKKLMRNFDYPLLLIIFILFTIGLVAIASATFVDYGWYYVARQIFWIFAGLIAIVGIISIDYNSLGANSLYIYILLQVSLAAVLVFGQVVNGSKSWFGIGGFGIQPSEIGKVMIIITLSKYLDKIKEQDENLINSPVTLIKLCLHLALPVFLILLQGDNGTAMVFVAIFCVLLFAAGISYRYVLTALGAGLASIPIFIFLLFPRLPDYVQKRFIVFLNPSFDPLGAGYHAIKSQLAIGSGQLWGMGFMKGNQTQLGGLPESHTDFIFSVIGEEMGFVWSAFIVVLYILLFMRCLYLAKTARDYYGSLLVTGITAMIAVHVFQNIGMTIGLLPITGIPLPFLSYGGSSFLANVTGIGLVLNVAMRRQKINF